MNTETTAATTTETESAITITPVEGTALHHRYRGQTSAQPAHVELDCDTGKLSASHNTEIGSGVPVKVWHSRTLRWRIPALTAEAANALLEEIAPLCERIVAGYEKVWDGNNHVGQFDDDAIAARDEVYALCDRNWSEGEVIEVWDAADWYGAVGRVEAQANSLGITATTTDEELAVIEEREENEAAPRLLEGLARHLKTLRQHAIDTTPSADDIDVSGTYTIDESSLAGMDAHDLGAVIVEAARRLGAEVDYDVTETAIGDGCEGVEGRDVERFRSLAAAAFEALCSASGSIDGALARMEGSKTIPTLAQIGEV